MVYGFHWLTYLASPLWISLARWINLYSPFWVVTLSNEQKIEICKPLAAKMIHEILRFDFKKRKKTGHIRSFFFISTWCIFNKLNRSECISALCETVAQTGISHQLPVSLSGSTGSGAALSKPCLILLWGLPFSDSPHKWQKMVLTTFELITLKLKQMAPN